MSGIHETAEDVAGRVVARILKGTYTINDTGAEAGQYDVRIDTEQGRTVAMEVTSFGSDDWERTRARIEAQRRKGQFAGEKLRHQWWVILPTGSGIRELEPRLTDLLAQLEAQDLSWATSRYDDADPVLREAAQMLAEISVNAVQVWEESPPAGQPRILLSQSESGIGTAGALPAAITAVFEKRDNQEKLARATCDERHLYVVLEDHGSGAVLEGGWPVLPGCPADPEGVVDVLWVWSRSISAYLFRAEPGTANWERFNSVSGDPL